MVQLYGFLERNWQLTPTTLGRPSRPRQALYLLRVRALEPEISTIVYMSGWNVWLQMVGRYTSYVESDFVGTGGFNSSPSYYISVLETWM
jgi:hypothetical protein